MLNPVTVRMLRDAVTPYGPKAAGDEFQMGGRRAALLVQAGAAEIVEATPTTPPADPFAGLSADQVKALQAAGFTDADAIRAASDDALLAVTGIGPAAVKHLRQATSA